MNPHAVGFFDSGRGGLCIRDAFRRECPDESTVYLADSRHCPYGIRPPRSEILLYLLVELIGSSCYSAILYSEPCSLEVLKPSLFESVRRIIRQFREESL